MTQTILLIDDSAQELRQLVSMLKETGYRLIISCNGADGVQRAALFRPDLILLDIRMPKMDGFAACRLIKADPQTRNIPIIFLSAANDVSQRLEGLRLGACDYIVKPPVEEEVLLRVNIHMRTVKPSDSRKVPPAYDLEFGMTLPRFTPAACQLVRDMPAADWTPDLLASKVGTNRKTLTKEFKQIFGSTIMGWVREYRMQQASRCLQVSDLSVQNISSDLGFDSSANFATAFRQRFGVSPTEYRHSLRQFTH